MDTNTTTINGKPVPSPAKEVMEDLASDRDELAKRLVAIKSLLSAGRAAEARRSVARVLTSVMSELELDTIYVCEQLAAVMDYLEVAESAEDYVSHAAEVEL